MIFYIDQDSEIRNNTTHFGVELKTYGLIYFEYAFIFICSILLMIRTPNLCSHVSGMVGGPNHVPLAAVFTFYVYLIMLLYLYYCIRPIILLSALRFCKALNKYYIIIFIIIFFVHLGVIRAIL